MDQIIVKGARENNLKNIDNTLPKNKLIVMTGVSGSGKSSLAFDTIYAEGQRRYIESLSAYARQFLGGSEKPDVDSIEGLSPAISIDQKTTNKNPRSTVGTVTEIYDYLRLLYARIGIPYCPRHDIPISSQSIEEMVNDVLALEERTKIRVLGPVAALEKGTHKDLLDSLRKDGYVRVLIDGEEYDLSEDITLDKNKKHTIEVVVDRLVIKPEIRSRLYESMETATKLGKGKPSGFAPEALARQSQAQSWNRSDFKFCKPRAQWPGGNSDQSLRFCAPEMIHHLTGERPP